MHAARKPRTGAGTRRGSGRFGVVPETCDRVGGLAGDWVSVRDGKVRWFSGRTPPTCRRCRRWTSPSAASDRRLATWPLAPSWRAPNTRDPDGLTCETSLCKAEIAGAAAQDERATRCGAALRHPGRGRARLRPLDAPSRAARSGSAEHATTELMRRSWGKERSWAGAAIRRRGASGGVLRRRSHREGRRMGMRPAAVSSPVRTPAPTDRRPWPPRRTRRPGGRCARPPRRDARGAAS